MARYCPYCRYQNARTGAPCPTCRRFEQALHARPRSDELIHHSDRGVQHLAIHYTDRLAEAGIEGSVGDSYDNALAETIIGLFKTEVIRRRSPWRNIDDVELATLEWVGWFNRRRLLGRSASFRRSNSRSRTLVLTRPRPQWLVSCSSASGDPGAVHLPALAVSRTSSRR